MSFLPWSLGTSCDRKFLKGICWQQSTLVLHVQHVHLLKPYAEALRAHPVICFCHFPSLFCVSENEEVTLKGLEPSAAFLILRGCQLRHHSSDKRNINDLC